VVAAICVLVVAPSAPAREGPRPTANAVVSIEFDHAFTDQLPAIQLANQLGMKVTLFAMSGRLGLPGYLSAEQLRSLQSAGNEIGGHTIDHQDLSQLPPSAQRQAVCDDRAALEADGLNATDFAYPYGHFNSATPGIVRGCGYQSARGVGGLAQPGCRSGCQRPSAESIPPADPFDTRTADSVLDTTSLATIESYVTQAERSGGWVQIIFHYVCDHCDPYSVTMQTFSQFATWLAARAGRGTHEETVRQVIETPFVPGSVWVAGRPAQYLRVAQACPSTPVGAPCKSWPRAQPGRVRLRAGQTVLVRTASSAQFVSFAPRGKRAIAAAPLVRPRSARERWWRISMPRSSGSWTGVLGVRDALGRASYRLQVALGNSR
jgi:peptidoglycan/xylan/chitin deacetylase (PgdA/CDA1 family)